MTTRTIQENPLLRRIVALEECRVIERWYFQGDAVHILLTLPVRSQGCGCGMEHCWFVNRDGKTRCWLCDETYVKERAEQSAQAGMPVPLRR
jgi:hypothetical protein